MLLFKKWGLTMKGKEHKPTCRPLHTGSSSFCQMWHKPYLIALAWALRSMLPLGEGMGNAEATRLQVRVHKISRTQKTAQDKKPMTGKD